MEPSKTYTKRENARRAAVATGVPAERVEITVHKKNGEIRFGWKVKTEAAPNAAESVVTTEQPKKETALKVEREERNGVKRPKEGSLCAAVWAFLDAHPGMTVKEAKAAAPEHSWNENNVACEFYQWRKFMGIGRRAVAPADA